MSEAAHNIERFPDRIELRDENGTVVARLGPTQFEDALLFAAAPALAELARKAAAVIDQHLATGTPIVGLNPLAEFRKEMNSLDLKGWALFGYGNTGLQEIQPCDDVGLFVTEEEAIEHVRNLAARGDADALKAIEIHDRDAPEIARQRQERETALEDTIPY